MKQRFLGTVFNQHIALMLIVSGNYFAPPPPPDNPDDMDLVTIVITTRSDHAILPDHCRLQTSLG